MNSAWLGWGLAVAAVAAGYVGYGWKGVVLAVTVAFFWLLLQFSQSLRVLRIASGRPVGLVPNAVMFNAFSRSIMNPPTTGTTRKARGDGPYCCVMAFMFATAFGVAPRPKPISPADITAAS